MGTYILQLARSESSYIFLASVSIQVPLDNVLCWLKSNQYAIPFVFTKQILEPIRDYQIKFFQIAKRSSGSNTKLN